MITRPDWRVEFKTPAIDLSRNVHFDSTLDRKIKSILANQTFNNYPNQFTLYQAISDHYEVPMSNLSIGYGATELLERLLKVLPLKHVYIVEPSFEMFEVYCQLYDIPHTKISYEDLEQITSGDTLYVVNPNGNDGTCRDLSKHLKKFKYNIIDEVYSDFCDKHSLLHDYSSNNIVVKSFSKSLGLAGYRTGFAVANKDVTSALQLHRSNFIMSSFSSLVIPQVIGLTSEVVDRMLETKAHLESRYECAPSHANYVLFKEQNDYTSTFGYKYVGGYYRTSLIDMDTLCRLRIT